MPARLKSIKLKSGDEIDISKNLTVLVGPNNVGKSVLLNSLWSKMNYQPGYPPLDTPVVESIKLVLPSITELREKLATYGVYRTAGQYDNGQVGEDHYYIRSNGHIITESQLRMLYELDNSDASTLGNIAGYVAVILQPENRLGQLAQMDTPNLLNEDAQAPIQIMYKDRDLETKLAAYARRAFQIDLTLNRHAGSRTSLHIGKPDAREPRVGELTDYQSQLSELPVINQQGHGVQAMLGMLGNLIVKAHEIVIIDEPEAFLHPPQARLLGEILVELSKQQIQVIISTHSDDILQGVLKASASRGDVTIARLTRPSETVNKVAQVNPASVKSLFDDPLLRYSNVLNGIFYKGVVLCESESDCKYYSAVLDHMYSGDETGKSKPDILFTQCGGKDRLAKAYKALQTTKVPTAIIADIDVMNDKAKFKELFETTGGDFATIEGKYNDVDNGARSKSSAPKRTYLRDKLSEILESSDAQEISKDEDRKIRETIKVMSGWDEIKKSGVSGLPSGAATKSFNSIVQASAANGLHVLSVGELERFHPEVTTNKQTWIREVFENELYKASPDAENLLKSVINYISQSQ